jgi:hypothetical protein
MDTKAVIGVAAIILLIAGALFLFTSSNTLLTQTAAEDAVMTEFPSLAAYRTTTLPPSSITGKQAANGWYLAFIQRGSGVPGVLNAQCFFVTNEKAVTATGQYTRPGDAVTENVAVEDCTPVNEQTPRNTVVPYGDVTLSMGGFAKFKDISIRPTALVEDSRCPADVQCIQAGTVRIKIEIVSGMGTSTSILTLGKEFTTEAERITLTAVTPQKRSQTQIATGEYQLTFKVVPQSAPAATTPIGKCYVGGCSSQLCTDNPDAVSTCEYTEKYACYKTATCERQASGQCGWTETPALTACIAAAL